MPGITVIDMNDPAPQKPRAYRKVPARPVRATEEQVVDPKVLSKILSSLQDEVGALTVVTQLFDSAVLFLNVALGAGGAVTSLGHNFGRYAMYLVLDFAGGLVAPWTPSTVYGAGAITAALSNTPAGATSQYYRTAAGGTSAVAGAEPVWPLTPGATVVDNTVTWINQAPMMALQTCSVQDDRLDLSPLSTINLLALRSYVSGTAAILVFG